MKHQTLILVLLIANMLMATRLTLTLSLSRSRSRSIRPLLKRTCSIFNHKHFNKSHPCPLWSSSFSFCIDSLHNSTSPSFTASSLSASSMAASAIESNPILEEFVFPPFDVVEPKHVRPGIRTLLNKLVTSCYLLGFC